MFSYKTSAFAALAGLSLVAIPPVVRAATIDVVVGALNGSVIAYTPNYVNASVGDVVRFTFQQKNHTVTQSSFASPCSPLTGGFDSGFVPVEANATSGFQTADLTIQNTDPVWVYCRQTGHCEEGMVFAVNPGSEAKFAEFQAAAMGSNSSTTSTAVASIVTVTATVTESGGEVATTTYGSYPGSVAPTSPTSTDHLIIVGNNGTLTYSPSNITAQVGDTVTFQFSGKNHTVTQSSFPDPCTELSTSSPGTSSFDSGFMFIANGTTTFPTFTIQINNTTPIWGYCRQTNPISHCESGMVFSINAVETSANTFEAFQAKALALNATAASLSSPSASSTSNSASSSRTSIRDAGIAFVVVALSSVVGAVLL